MKSKDTRTIMERAKDLEMVFTFSILKTVEKYYIDIENYKRIYAMIVSGKATSKEQVEFCKRFGFGKDMVRKILGSTYDENGKRHYVTIGEAQPYFSPRFHYQRHFKKQFKSGKCYQVHGYWFLDFDHLSNLMGNEAAHDTNSDFYTQRQHQFIDNLILKFNHTTVKMTRQKQKTTITTIKSQSIKPTMTYNEFQRKATMNYIAYIHSKHPSDYPTIEEVEEYERREREWKERRLAEIAEEKKKREEEQAHENEIPKELMDEILNEIGNLDD